MRETNRTRRLRRLPKAFTTEDGYDLLDWLENHAINDEAVFCAECRDMLPGETLCQHSWWCDKTGNYSTPTERCSCKDREECRA